MVKSICEYTILQYLGQDFNLKTVTLSLIREENYTDTVNYIFSSEILGTISANFYSKNRLGYPIPMINQVFLADRLVLSSLPVKS